MVHGSCVRNLEKARIRRLDGVEWTHYLTSSGAGESVDREGIKKWGHNNKHCEILVSCSDKERNCIQALEIACKLIELPGSSGNCM